MTRTATTAAITLLLFSTVVSTTVDADLEVEIIPSGIKGLPDRMTLRTNRPGKYESYSLNYDASGDIFFVMSEPVKSQRILRLVFHLPSWAMTAPIEYGKHSREKM